MKINDCKIPAIVRMLSFMDNLPVDEVYRRSEICNMAGVTIRVVEHFLESNVGYHLSMPGITYCGSRQAIQNLKKKLGYETKKCK